MSLNDYFAANGAVYLRQVGLPDCFPMPGLPHGCKPPSLSMQPPPPQKPRTMAAVSPLHQVVASQANLPSPYEGAFNTASRTSSFAAALRKLAKQAVDPISGEKDLTQISPISSPVLNQGSLTPKRSVPTGGAPPPPSMFLTSHQVSYASSSPPVVTIAPSRSVNSHTAENRKANNSNSMSNGHLPDSLGGKMDPNKGVPRPAHSDKWEEQNKGSSNSSQVRPHATIAPLPRPDDSLTSSRGFQPYRGTTEESRNTLPHHLSLFEHHHPAASYPYTPAFLPPPHLSHPAYRFDDPLYLERYSLLRPPVMPYPQAAASMMGPSAAFYPNSRYAADLIAQSLSISSANNSAILNHERLKQEEERRIREKELELDQSRNKEREKENREREQHKEMRDQREKEKREKSHKEKEDHTEHKKGSSHGGSNYKRTESPNVRNTSHAYGSSNSTSAPPTTIASSIPLNLVVQPSGEPLKKEAELWMPWQQPPNKDSNQEIINNQKHPAFRSQDGSRSHHTKENHTRSSPPSLHEKKHISAPSTEPPADEHKRPPDGKRFDSLHHHIAELSSKDHGPHEWRHEKLQKACTNNHRKTHESKRSKEDRNVTYPNHQRKVVNGAVLKQPTAYQNEGMHARLLETEKCRLELNGHPLPPKIQTTISANDRFPIPNLKSSHKDTPTQKSLADFYGVPIFKSNVELTPVVSKIDLDAKRMKLGDLKYTDDDSKEELRLKNFLILTKVPPKNFEPNSQKLKFLKLFGLTTHFKRKKIEFDMYLKRRKIMKEDTDIPPSSPEHREEDISLPSPVIERNFHFERLSEQLRTETHPIKYEFLFRLGLTPLTLAKKEEKERVRRIVEEEKVRRHYRLLAKVNKKSSPRRLFVPKSEAAQRLDHLRKLREMNSVSNGFISKRLSDEEEEMGEEKFLSSSQLKTPKVEKVPYLQPKSGSSVSPNSSSATTPTERSESPYSPLNNKTPNKYSFKRGHSLKSEFRFATPSTNYKGNHLSRLNSVSSASVASCSVGTQVESSLFDKSLADLKNFNWPGLDTIMEVIYKHQNEQSSERGVLSERCHQLRQAQEELKKEAENLSRQMSELLRTKRDLDEERQKHQRSIDHLKQCLHLGR